MYKITDYSKEQARKLGVIIKPSTNKNKKIDVFKEGKKVASIGALNYMDYPNYLLINKELAEEKRKNYKKRFENTRHIKNTNSFYADKILW